MVADSERVPVILLAGFLGSGKTTLLNRILQEPQGRRFAVIVNEFGDVGIDGRLVVGAREELIELANGCLCCTVREDLRSTLASLTAKRTRRFFAKPFDHVVIEASGLASPGPAVQTLLIDPELAAAYRLSSVVTMVHAALIRDQLRDHPEAEDQVGYADSLVVNHMDRCDEKELELVKTLVISMNSQARYLQTTRAQVSMKTLFADHRCGIGGAKADDAPFRVVRTRHSEGVSTVSLESETPLDIHRLKMWLQFLSTRRTHQIMRMKGIVRCPQVETSVIVQAVYQWIEIGPGKEPCPEVSRLVIIGRDLDRDEINRGFEVCR